MGAASSSPSTPRPVVVIVGGGGAGMNLASPLDKSGLYEVIVIDRRNYYFHNPGALRAAVEPAFLKQIALPFDKSLRNGVVIQGEVESVDTANNHVYIHGRRNPLRYDHLVFATGSSSAFPLRVHLTDSHKLQQVYDSFNSELRAARNVVIIGGGAVGVEMAAEIGTDFPDKQVVLVQRSQHLLTDRIHPKHEKAIMNKLTKLNVNVLLGQSVDIAPLIEQAGDKLYLPGPRKLTTSSGTQLAADFIILSTGPRVNSNAYAYTGSPLASSVHEDRLVVDEYFRVKSVNNANVYAIGDCAFIESQQMFFAQQQGAHLANNFIALSKGRALKPYKATKSDSPILFVSLGRKGGSGEMGGSVFSSWLVTMLKSKNFFAPQAHGLLKTKPLRDSLAHSVGPIAVSAPQRQALSASVGLNNNEVEELLQGFAAKPVGPRDLHV